MTLCWPLYYFPRVAVIKYNPLGNLRKWERVGLIVLQAGSLKSRCWQVGPSEGSEGKFVPGLSPSFW